MVKPFLISPVKDVPELLQFETLWQVTVGHCWWLSWLISTLSKTLRPFDQQMARKLIQQTPWGRHQEHAPY
jgi:hypothetical protein